MATHPPLRGSAAELTGRRSERDVLDRLIEGCRAGEGRALVVRGEPGGGKTALLEHVVGQASGCRVARAAGVQSEMELAFAGLHQLLAPMLDRLERLPVPQRDALRTAFGVSPGSAPDRFLVALAVLSLLSDVAEEQPLICLVDDEQWLDGASAQVLAFVARRLEAESVGLVFAARPVGEELAGLPELVVEGLRDGDARVLLDSVFTGPLDARVRDQFIAETRGNPLALLELPRGLRPAELAVDSGCPARLRCRGGSRRASSGSLMLCRPRPGAWCSSRRPIRSATRCWYGEPPSGSGSVPGQRRQRRRPGCSNSAPKCGSGIRWCARWPTGRPRFGTGRRCTGRWRRSPIRSSIPTGGAGPRRRPVRAPTGAARRGRGRSAGRGRP